MPDRLVSDLADLWPLYWLRQNFMTHVDPNWLLTDSFGPPITTTFLWLCFFTETHSLLHFRPATCHIVTPQIQRHYQGGVQSVHRLSDYGGSTSYDTAWKCPKWPIDGRLPLLTANCRTIGGLSHYLLMSLFGSILTTLSLSWLAEDGGPLDVLGIFRAVTMYSVNFCPPTRSDDTSLQNSRRWHYALLLSKDTDTKIKPK